MEITINSDAEKTRNKHKILWRLYALKNYRTIGFNFLVGILLLILGTRADYSFKTFSEGGATVYNLNFFFSFGIAFILLSIIYLYHMFKGRYKYFKSLDRQLYRGSPQLFFSNMVINDAGLYFTGKDMKQELKWTLFTHYKLYKHYLLFITDDISIYSIIINMQDLDNNASSELLAFAKKTLIKK